MDEAPNNREPLIAIVAAGAGRVTELEQRRAIAFRKTDRAERIETVLPAEGRVGILEPLWEVAYADGQLHVYEASLLRRVAGLLYVSDRESGEARLRVMAKLGLPR